MANDSLLWNDVVNIVPNISRVTKQNLAQDHFNVYTFAIQSESKLRLYKSKVKHLSIPVKHKVGNAGIFVQLPSNINWKVLRVDSILMQSYICHSALN